MSPFLSCVCTVCSINFLAHELSCFCDKQLICLDLSFTLLILVLLFSLSPQFRIQFSLGNSCANMARGIEMMGRLGIANWDCWDKPFLTEEGLAAAWCLTDWWGNGCSPCPRVKVKVKHEQKFKCSGMLSSAGCLFWFPLRSRTVLFAVQVVYVSDSSWCFTDLKWSEFGLPFSCMNPAKSGCLFPFQRGQIGLGLYCKPLFSSDWHMWHCLVIGPKTLCVIFVWVVVIGLIQLDSFSAHGCCGQRKTSVSTGRGLSSV